MLGFISVHNMHISDRLLQIYCSYYKIYFMNNIKTSARIFKSILFTVCNKFYFNLLAKDKSN